MHRLCALLVAVLMQTHVSGRDVVMDAGELGQSGLREEIPPVTAVSVVAGRTFSSVSSVFRDKVQPVIDYWARYHNVSYSLAVRSQQIGGTVRLVTGADDRLRRRLLTPAGKFPMGSVTKSWTAVRIMQYHEQGLIDIDAPISRYVDPVLRRMNGTTMAELWNHDPRIENVTARLIMSMRSGLHDYNDTAFYDFVFAQPRPPRQFLNPFDVLHRVNKSFVCNPGACGYYASPPVELLGLAACHIQGCTSWEDLDQLPANNTKDNTETRGCERSTKAGWLSRRPILTLLV